MWIMGIMGWHKGAEPNDRLRCVWYGMGMVGRGVSTSVARPAGRGPQKKARVTSS
jgi:hypothetical protein